MDSASLNLDSFFLNGYVIGKFFEDVSSYRKCYFPDCNDPAIGENIDFVDTPTLADLDRLHKLVGQNIVSQIFKNYTLTGKGMWAGVDDGSNVWHNDFTNEGNLNTNILVYLDSTEDQDNCIEIKDTTLGTYNKVLPQQNDFVWLNQSAHFEHKATHNGGNRRVLSFEFFVDGLNNKTN